MKRNMPLILLTLLALLAAGCEVFPYVTQPTTTVSVPPVTPTAEPTEAPPTATLAPYETPTPTEITEAPSEPTPTGKPAYTLQPGSPVALPNFNHPEAGCAWLGVAGQVFDEQELEVLGLTVLVGDTQNPNADPYQAQTGDALAYGRGGYEIRIAEEVLDTNERFWIQVVNAEGASLTARHAFDTTADCGRNLILINFVPLPDPGPEMGATTPEPTLPAYP